MKPHELLTLSRDAHFLMKLRDFAGAAHKWENLLDAQPDWGHGMAAYNLATCYEDSGRTEDAARLYRQALGQEPENVIFLGGYGSFLYLHGPTQDAFDAYGKLLRMARAGDDVKWQAQLNPVLVELGMRLGLSEAEVLRRLA